MRLQRLSAGRRRRRSASRGWRRRRVARAAAVEARYLIATRIHALGVNVVIATLQVKIRIVRLACADGRADRTAGDRARCRYVAISRGSAERQTNTSAKSGRADRARICCFSATCNGLIGILRAVVLVTLE